MRMFLVAFCFMFAIQPVWALGIDENRLKDPAQEARAHDLMRTFRCLVCQNESIEDSNAPLAADLRGIVRERIAAGDTNAEVKAYMVARYGDWVLLKPPFNLRTVILWIGPFVLLLGGALFLLVQARRRNRSPAETPPLTPEEKQRLGTLLDDDERRRDEWTG